MNNHSPIRTPTWGKGILVCLFVLLGLCQGTRAQVLRDSTDIHAGDSLIVAGDSLIVAGDSITAMGDSIIAAGDSLTANGDSITAAGDSLIAISDSLRVSPALSKPKRTFTPDPMRAMWLAMVVPGGGQIYNRKYWKLPIIYGGFLGCAYALTWNNQMLKDYSQAYLDIMDSDPATNSYQKMLPFGYDITGREEQFKEIFKNKKNHFRRYRDMSIFAFGAVYLLSVIDAYVDAELSTFDISRDLSLQVAPASIETYHTSAQSPRRIPALQLALNF